MDINDLRVKLGEVIGPRLQSLQMLAAGMAVIGAVLAAIGAVTNATQFWASYLYAYTFWAGISIGSLALLLLHHTVGGGWGFVLRRFLESGVRLLPVMLILALPILFLGMPHLYSWARPEAATDAILQKKAMWLNVPGFMVRTFIYYSIWMIFGYFLLKLGGTQDRSQDERTTAKVSTALNKWGAAGLLVYVITVTFAAVDWVMSITPHWYSSIFGLMMLASQGLSTLALMIALAGYLGGRTKLIQEAPSGFLRDLGNFMLAFTMLWAYMSFSQLIITYSGNTVEEVSWYIERTRNNWWIFAAINGIHFFLPFFILLTQSKMKKDPARLGLVGLLIVVLRLLDIFWWVMPTFTPAPTFNLAIFGAPLALGGIWLFLWANGLKDKTAVPVHDPRLESALPLHVEAHHG